MNLLEHYIEKVYRETDITEKFRSRIDCSGDERYIEVEMDVDCYGVKENVRMIFSESEWRKAKHEGYYMA